MLLCDLNIKKAYSSDDSDILNDFYIPALECSCEYYRLTGYFSSKSLFLASRGIQGLINNNGTIKLISSPFFSEEDINVIKSSTLNEDLLSETLNRSMEEDDTNLHGNNLKILAYLLKTYKLEIRIAVILNELKIPLTGHEMESRGIFHQKVGILRDTSNNTVSFSGSINETAAAWKSNIEEFKVFRGWEKEELEYVKTDILKFEKYWNGDSGNLKIYNLPSAVKENILRRNSTYKTEKDKNTQDQNVNNKLLMPLFDYQERAILSWQSNNYKGIFEMATGTGKTYTALNCYLQLLQDNPPFVTIISCPYNHLLIQWENELAKLDSECRVLLCDGSNPTWKNNLLEYLTSFLYYNKFRFVILSTHTTLSNRNFRECIERFQGVSFFLIADEVHGLGAKMNKQGLLPQYLYRLGLSATPKRWFDQEGTDYIYDYFNKVVFEFPLKDAISQINPLTGKTYLTPFYYHLKFTNLDDEELDEYIKFTRKILVNASKNGQIEEDQFLKLLIFKRSNIIKNCSRKLLCISEILNEITKREGNLKGTIIYCTPQQMDSVINILHDRSVIFNKITMHEGTTPLEKYMNISEREYILKNFATGDFEVLVAIKCLDEGIDIPQAKNAILLASSGNPREYIQRIGRVIRRFNEKVYANIFDIIVSPSFSIADKDIRILEEKIFSKELNRVKEIAINALNNIEVFNIINNLNIKS